MLTLGACQSGQAASAPGLPHRAGEEADPPSLEWERRAWTGSHLGGGLSPSLGPGDPAPKS